MGLFEVNVKLASLAAPDRVAEVSLLVDTGATMTWVPRALLQSLGVVPTSKLRFELADGRMLEREIGAVLMTIDGRVVPVPVAFAEAGDSPVLGATSLEAMGFAVDPVSKTLIPRNLIRVSTRL